MLSISRKDLYSEIWSIRMTKAAKKFDIPYNKLKKACINHNIPLPTQSYWSKLYMGNEKPSQPELQNAENNLVITIQKAKKQQVKSVSKTLVKPAKIKEKEESSIATKYDKLSEQDENRLINIYNNIKINKTLSSKPHKVIVKYRVKRPNTIYR